MLTVALFWLCECAIWPCSSLPLQMCVVIQICMCMHASEGSIMLSMCEPSSIISCLIGGLSLSRDGWAIFAKVSIWTAAESERIIYIYISLHDHCRHNKLKWPHSAWPTNYWLFIVSLLQIILSNCHVSWCALDMGRQGLCIWYTWSVGCVMRFSALTVFQNLFQRWRGFIKTFK